MSNVVTAKLAPNTFIKDEIQIALEKSLQHKSEYLIVNPTQEDIQHVGQVFKDKQLNNIAVINYSVVSEIGKKEFNTLNLRLKEFTSKMTAIKTPGIFNLIDELQKNIAKEDLEGIWEKTVNAKPSLMARMHSWFSPSAIATNLNKQYEGLYKNLTTSSKGLELKLGEIESKLIDQKHIQENNIKALTASFEVYYYSLQELRQQFIFILYLEEFYKQEFEKFVNSAPNKSDLMYQKQLGEYQGVMSDIENRRLVLHGALVKMPIIVKQNENLITVCRNIVKEIDNTLLSNFTSIRSNLLGLGVSLNAQQALNGTNSAKLLDEQSSRLAMKINSELTIKAETFASSSRLREAQSIKLLVDELKHLSVESQRAKEQSRREMQEAADVLNTATVELQQFLGNNR